MALSAAALVDMARNGEDTSLWNGQPPPNPWHTLGPWRMIGASRSATYMYQGQKHSVAIAPAQDAPGAWSVQVDAYPAEEISCVFGTDDLVLLRRGARQIRTFVQRQEGETQVIVDGQTYHFARRQPPNVDTAARGGNVTISQKALAAPMAGTIVKVQVHDGAYDCSALRRQGATRTLSRRRCRQGRGCNRGNGIKGRKDLCKCR